MEISRESRATCETSGKYFSARTGNPMNNFRAAARRDTYGFNHNPLYTTFFVQYAAPPLSPTEFEYNYVPNLIKYTLGPRGFPTLARKTLKISTEKRARERDKIGYPTLVSVPKLAKNSTYHNIFYISNSLTALPRLETKWCRCIKTMAKISCGSTRH